MSVFVNLDKAITFAAKAHEGQFRKGNRQPYIFHPLEVLSLASQITEDEDILCACVLHDTVEDTDTTINDINKEFGSRIAKLVYFESEDKRTDLPPEETWKIRKEETIKTLNETNEIGAKIICLCDKVSNLRSFNLLRLQEGNDMWNHFHQNDPKMHCWYYQSLKDALKDLSDTAIYKEYCFLFETIFKDYI